jgi:hypothetical protein
LDEALRERGSLICDDIIKNKSKASMCFICDHWKCYVETKKNGKATFEEGLENVESLSIDLLFL